MKALQTPVPINAEKTKTGATTKILIVDDELYVCRLLARWLSAEHYECHTAGSARQALELLDQDDFALVVADIMMPGMSGMKLLATMKERYPNVAGVMVTGVDDRQTAIRALEIGAYGYVIKPFDQNEVVINVVNALERRRLLMESRKYERSLEDKVREQTHDLRRSREEITLRLVAAQEYRHDETGAHIRRIGLYAEAMARGMSRSEEYAELLRLSAPMHDVGKMGIPDSILLKPGKLTQDEFEVMKTHTTIGARILEGSNVPVLNMSRDIALRHHERWDGSGYPNGIEGPAIPEAARIVAVLDVYDALVSNRVYRPAFLEEKALDVMSQENGTHFDPDIFAAFHDALPVIRDIRAQVRDPGVPIQAQGDQPVHETAT